MRGGLSDFAGVERSEDGHLFRRRQKIVGFPFQSQSSPAQSSPVQSTHSSQSLGWL